MPKRFTISTITFLTMLSASLSTAIFSIISSANLPAFAAPQGMYIESPQALARGRLRALETEVDNENKSRAELVESYAKAAQASSTASAPMDRQCAQMIGRAQEEYTVAVRNKIDLVRNQIEFYSTQLRHDIAAVPKYYFDQRGVKRENRDYDFMVQSLNDAYEVKTTNLIKDAEKSCNGLQVHYTKRMMDVIASRESLKGQMTSRVGNNRVVPVGTNMYVRNYENFGGVHDNISGASTQTQSLPAALMAVTKRLSDSTTGKQR